MNNPSDDWEELRRKVLGLGDSSLDKTHYPSLRRRLAELEQFCAKLERGQAYLLAAQRLSHTGSFGWNVSADEQVWSEETFRIFGYDASTKITAPLVLERVHPEDRTLVRETLDRAVRERSGFDYEHRLLMPDGSVKHLHVVARAVEREPGNVRFVGAVMDVTAQKRAEESRQESELWRRLTEALPQLVWAATPDGACDYFSTQWREYTGVPESELLGWRWLEVLHPDDREATRQSWADSVAGRGPYDVEYRIRRSDGAYGWFKTRGAQIRNSQGDIVKWFGTCTDITDRKQAEDALRQSERELRQARNGLEMKVAERTTELRRTAAYLAEAQRLSHTGSFGWKASSNEFLWSEETFRIFEYDASTRITPPLIVERVHPEDRAMRQEMLERAAREGGDIDFEYRLLLPDGSVKHIHIVAHAVRGGSGGLEYIGALMDVTAQKSQQQALEKAFQEMEALKNQFRLAVDTIPGLVWSALPDGSTEFLNQRWLDYTGLSVKEGVDWTVAAHAEDRARLVEEWRAALTSGKPLETEGRLRRADGAYRWFLIRCVPLRDETGSIVKWYGKTSDIQDRKQAEAKLRESEQRYRRIVDTASEGIIVFDERYVATFVNRRMADLVGYEPEEMAGRPFSDYVFEEDLAGLEAKMTARRRGVTERYEQRVRRKDGRPLWVHVSTTPILDAERRFQGSFAMFTDITQRKMAEDELRKHRDHLEDLVKQRTEELALLNQLVYGSLASTDVGAWWIDFKEPDTYHALDNTVQMLGNTPDKTGDKSYRLSRWARTLADTKAAFPQYAKVIDETMERLSGAISGKHKDYRAVYPVAMSDGSVKWFDGRADVPLRDEQGRALLMTGTLIDITRLKQTEDALVEAKERAEAANRAKSIFLASMSHELRTPLNVVLGFSRLMENDPGIPANQKENLHIIVRNGEQLLNLINNVLDISKIESGRVVLERSEVDLRQLLHELRSSLGVGAAEKGLSFTLEESPALPRRIAVDAGKLCQVLVNLIGNATKYTESGGVKLRAGVASWEGPQRARLRFEVEDSGAGISKEDQERIFFPFVQLGNRAPIEAGSGLGLAISKQYVELMGGKIGVASEPGKGSVFHFEVPVEALPAAEAPAELERGRITGLADSQPRFRILIAEDQPENRLLLHKLFEPLGFELRDAANGREAAALSDEWRPHLIWMDIRMPVMDGLEAARRIKATEAGRRTKIIALTAHALDEERKPILEAGCDDLVRKPYREQELFEVMARHLGLKYLYAKPGEQITPAGPKAAIRPEQWAALPAELLTQLRQAAVELDTSRTLALIRRVSEHDAAIGGVLNELARVLDYRHLLELLESEPAKAGRPL
jgi:PAS domain S-box-containing protein